MKALYLTSHFEKPADIHIPIKDLSKPTINENECLIKVFASGINQSDVLASLGYFEHARLPRIPGRDFSGLVVEGPKKYIGMQIWGTGGGAGIDFDGTHSEFIKLPLSAIAEMPKNLDPITAGAQTLPYVTAYYSIVTRAHLSAGETLLVTGALGQVGRACISIAHWKKCKAIALVLGQEQVKEAQQLGWQAVDSTATNVSEQILALNQNKPVDVILNGLGNICWDTLMDSLAPFGRIVTISAREKNRVAEINLFKLYRNNQGIIGTNSVSLNYTESATLLNELKPGFENGNLIPLSINKENVYPLEDVNLAYQNVITRSEKGRIVLKIS